MNQLHSYFPLVMDFYLLYHLLRIQLVDLFDNLILSEDPHKDIAIDNRDQLNQVKLIVL